MAVNETIVTGRKFRKLIDAANKQWQRISFWHKASDCEFDDGKTAQTKVGAIDGITSDLSGESETVAASIKCVNELNSSLTANNNQFYFDYQGGKYGFNTDRNRGADTFIPFSDSSFKISFVINAKTSGEVSSSIDQDSKWSNYNVSSTVTLSFDGKTFKMTGNSKSNTFGIYGGAEWVTVSCRDPKIIV